MKTITGAALDLFNRVPVPLGGGGSPLPFGRSKATQTDHLEAMEAHPTLFAIVDRISLDVGAAIWRLFRKGGLNRALKPTPREEVFVHPALTVWRKPNPFHTQAEYVEAMQQHYEVTGEYWWVLARSELLKGAGPPIELWVVRPDRMAPVKSKKDFISGYVYTVGREQIPLTTDDVIYNHRPNPKDPYRGLGPIGTLIRDIEGEKAAAEWNANFFKNNAAPGGGLRTPMSLTDEEYEIVQQRWRASHQGVANAHRVAVLEEGTEWVDMSYSMRDMQFEQLRRYAKETFREAWGFPKALLGDVEDVNRANAEAGEVVLSRHILVPRLRRLRTTLNDDFLPRFGPQMADGYEFDFDDPVPPDATQEREDTRMRVGAAVSLIAQGFDPEETLAAWELPAIAHTGEAGAEPAATEDVDGGA